MENTGNIKSIVVMAIEAKEKRDAQIEVVVAKYRKLQNKTTCREVDYAIEVCIERLVELTGFDKYQVMSAYADR